MSIQSWLEEFYPVEAAKATATDLVALDHSIQKWKGFTKENLGGHGLFFSGDAAIASAYVNEEIHAGIINCALCNRHHVSMPLINRHETGHRTCGNCPLLIVSDITTPNGEPFMLACYERRSITEDGPYEEFFHNGNPQPMINLLEQVREKVVQEIMKKGDVV